MVTCGQNSSSLNNTIFYSDKRWDLNPIYYLYIIICAKLLLIENFNHFNIKCMTHANFQIPTKIIFFLGAEQCEATNTKKNSLIRLIAVSKSSHWRLIRGTTWEFLLIVGFQRIKANCSLIKESCGVEISKIIKPQSGLSFPIEKQVLNFFLISDFLR